MTAWLREALTRAADHLTDEAEAYLMGRGVSEASIDRLQIGVWSPPEEQAPDPVFRKRHGDQGELLADRLVYPLRSPRGGLIGFESRSMHEKSVTRYLLPEAAWNPVLIGFPAAMEKVWAGGDIWVVEGLFDLTALERVIPERDAVVASVRAKLTQKHVEWVRRFMGLGKSTSQVYMVYDNDETGRRGVEGYIDENTGKPRWGALRQLERVEVCAVDVRYKGGKDPGEIWENSGTEGLRAAFAHVLPLM